MAHHPQFPVRSFFLCLLVIGYGCRPPRGNPPAVPDLPPTALLDRIDAAGSGFRDLKGSALVAATFNGRRGRVDTRIRFRRPDILKVFIQGVFQVLAVLSIRGEAVQLYLPRENIVFEGTLADGDVIVPGMQVPLIDVRTAVTGVVDLLDFDRRPLIEYRREGRRYVLAVQDSTTGDIRRIWIDPERAVVTREEEHRADGTIIVRRFEKYTKRKNIWRPTRISIRSEQTRETIELTYHTQSVNVGLTRADLKLRLPENVKHLPLNQADLFRR